MHRNIDAPVKMVLIDEKAIDGRFGIELGNSFTHDLYLIEGGVGSIAAEPVCLHERRAEPFGKLLLGYPHGFASNGSLRRSPIA